MSEPLVLNLPCLPRKYREFIRSLQAMLYVELSEDGTRYVINPDKEVNGADFIAHVAGWLRDLDLDPQSRSQITWVDRWEDEDGRR